MIDDDTTIVVPSAATSGMIDRLESGLQGMMGLSPGAMFSSDEMQHFVDFFDARSNNLTPQTISAIAQINYWKHKYPDCIGFQALGVKGQIFIQHSKVGASTRDFIEGISAFALRQLAKTGVNFSVNKQGS